MSKPSRADRELADIRDLPHEHFCSISRAEYLYLQRIHREMSFLQRSEIAALVRDEISYGYQTLEIDPD